MASGWNCSTRMLRSASETRLQPSLRPANAWNLRRCTSKLPLGRMHHIHSTGGAAVSRAVSVCSVPSSCALCVRPLGHCVCVPPGGGRSRRRPASENPQVRPQSSNSGPTTPIGPIPTRACVPVCVRRCDRVRRATGRRRRPDATGTHGRRRRYCRPPRPPRRPSRPPERGARRVRKIEPAHACTPRNRRERRPPQPPLPPRWPSPQFMPHTA